MDQKYYLKDVKWAKKQKFLKFKQGKTMTMLDYTTNFNELSHFTPAYVPTNEMRLERLEYRLKSQIKKELAGYSY